MLKDYPGDKKKWVIDICPATSWTERLCSTHSTILFLFISGIVSWRVAFSGEPMRCMLPAEQPSHWMDYFHTWCYMNGTYQHVDMADFVYSRNKMGTVPLNYYQFVPYMMIIQTFIWYVAHVFWRFCRHQTAFDLMAILNIIKKDTDYEDKSVESLVRHVQNHLKFAYKAQSFPKLIFVYLMSKWIYVVQSFVQLTIISIFVGGSDYFWGLKKFIHATRDGFASWNQLDEFPYVAYCDSFAAFQGQIIPLSFQCALTMNMLFDKVYVFLWFWTVLCLIVSICSAVYNTLLYLSPALAHRELCVILQLEEKSPKRRVVPVFLKKHLRKEGLLLLRIMAENYSPVLAFKFAHLFWATSEGI